jgi:capsular exopolysaccharide synthesis family protein
MTREVALIDYSHAVHDDHTTVERRPVLAEELVSFLAPTSFEAEQYRALRHVVERLRGDSGQKLFAVTSAEPGDGKTVTTLNLAGSLAQSPDARILVICADLHRDAVPQYLGLPSRRSPGFSEVILDERYSLADAAQRLDALNISFLPTGAVPAQPYELLTSPRLEGLLAEAQRLYDYVLVDTPPVVPLADCRLLARWIDAFIVVVAAKKTPRRLLGEALRQLDPAKVVGLVFNGDDRRLVRYAGYYGYQQPPSRGRPSPPVAWWERVLRWRRQM